MRKGFLIISLASFLFSCQEKVQDEIKIDPGVKCLSAFMFRSGGDTIRDFFFTTFLFKKDSVLILKPDSLAHWKVRVVHLDSAGITTLNKVMKTIEFKSYLNNTICKQVRESRTMYCGSDFGFIDSSGNVETFIPFEKHKSMDSIFSYLRNKQSEATNDTSEIMNAMQSIKRKYLKDCPPIPVMKSNTSK
jgi:hypothetical protein